MERTLVRFLMFVCGIVNRTKRCNKENNIIIGKVGMEYGSIS